LKQIDRKELIILLFCGLVLFPKPGLEAAWRVGCDLAVFPAMGNLELKKPVYEYEVFVNHESGIGAGYRAALSRSAPDPAQATDSTTPELTGIWLNRSARFRVWGLHGFICAGPGITAIVRRENGRKVIFGAFSFRSDITVNVWGIHGLSIDAGVSFRGCPLRSSGSYSDRFGVVLVVGG